MPLAETPHSKALLRKPNAGAGSSEHFGSGSPNVHGRCTQACTSEEAWEALGTQPGTLPVPREEGVCFLHPTSRVTGKIFCGVCGADGQTSDPTDELFFPSQPSKGRVGTWGGGGGDNTRRGGARYPKFSQVCKHNDTLKKRSF